jgi:hypothetical protein
MLAIHPIDQSEAFHGWGAVPTCASAIFVCYFANKLWPHHWFQVGAVVLSTIAISAFFVGTK